MNTDAILKAFNAKGRHPKWRAACPCHKSRSLTLAIYQDSDRVRVHCHAGCKNDDVLAAVGLTWKDLSPRPDRLSSEEYAAAKRKRREEERTAYRQRIRDWIAYFAVNPYTQEHRARDTTTACAAAMMMAASGEKDHLHRLLRAAMERITAADILAAKRGQA